MPKRLRASIETPPARLAAGVKGPVEVQRGGGDGSAVDLPRLASRRGKSHSAVTDAMAAENTADAGGSEVSDRHGRSVYERE